MSAFPGAGTTIVSGVDGHAISEKQRTPLRHPWFTLPRWHATRDGGQWTATVQPGFVNAYTPAFRATMAQHEALGNSVYNYLTGNPLFPAALLGQSAAVQAIAPVDIPLYLAPVIPLTFRAVGFDGDSRFPVPQFFQNLGVGLAPALPTGDPSEPQPPAAAPPQHLRLLRACDVWLHQPRLGLTSDVQLNPAGLITGDPTVIQTLGVKSPAPEDALRVLAGDMIPDTQSIDPLSADYVEPTFDELLISTVFLLSPPGTATGSDPDGTWQPFVRHNLFENLSWQHAEFHAPDVQITNVVIPPLAFGVASLVINSFGSAINQAAQNAANILKAASLAGSFWTPTGGGHTALDPRPAVPAQSDAAGLNKAANLNAIGAAEYKAKREEVIEPAFPWQAIPFPIALLTAA